MYLILKIFYSIEVITRKEETKQSCVFMKPLFRTVAEKNSKLKLFIQYSFSSLCNFDKSILNFCQMLKYARITLNSDAVIKF